MPSRAVVMGLGRFGGGLGAAVYLHADGYHVTVTDLTTRETLGPELDELPKEISLALGGHNEVDFEHADLLVVNPAVPKPWNNPHIARAREAGARVTTEIALVLDRLASQTVVAVTGTAGKSTTAALVHEGLASHPSYRSVLGGNIGGSLLTRRDELDAATHVVLELSSAMLWWLDQPGSTKKPAEFPVGIITNLAPNHLDWHGDLENYAACKQILATRTTEHLAVGDDTPWTTKATTSRPEPIAGELVLPGRHNRLNAALAAEACRTLGVKDDHAIRAFPGLPHRLRLVHTSRRGVRYYDDSKSTTPSATRLAVEALEGSSIHLIAGGYDKQIDLAGIADASRSCTSTWLVGATAQTLAESCDRASIAGTVDLAVRRVAEHADPGDAVLLSPGCASWDQFTDYTKRGEAFAKSAMEADP